MELQLLGFLFMHFPTRLIDAGEQTVAEELSNGMLQKHQARRLTGATA